MAKYTEEQIQKALKAIDNGMHIRKAAIKFQIPRATLQFRRSNKFKKTGHGPAPVLTKDEEATLVEWIFECHRKGFPRRKEDVLCSVKHFLDMTPRPNPFRNNCPGNGWYKSFLNRHPELATRTAEFVTKASSNISPNDLKKWFNEIEEYLKEKGYFHILEDPSRVFNGDETNFYLCPKNSKVLAPRGTSNVYEVENVSSKSNLTVMFTFSATGILTPPMVIYPYKRLPNYIIQSVPDGWGIGATETGWMRSETFYEYVSKVLYPFLLKSGTTFPIILFLDGHSTHLTLQLSNLCQKLKIILTCLYPNATRILQPADVAAFRPIKAGWKRAVRDWKRDNPTDSLTKEKFAPILEKSIQNSHNPMGIVNGFRACGICPWNVNAIDFSKCIGKVIKEKDEIVDTEINTKVVRNMLSYKKFISIIGTDKLKKITELDDKATYEDMLLNKILKEFDTVSEPLRTAHEGEVKIIYELEKSEIDTIDSKVELQSSTIPNTQPNTSLDCCSNFYVADAILEEKSFTSTTENNCQIFNIEEIPIIISEEQHISELVNDKMETQIEANKLITSEQDQSKDSLKDCLDWPMTPQRKGKRQTDHDSYVLTSTVWKKNKMEKEETKRQKEIEKEARKQKRAENKLQKENTKKYKNLKENKPKKKSILSKAPIPTSFLETIPEKKEPLLVTPPPSTVSPSRLPFQQMEKVNKASKYLFPQSPKIRVISDITLNVPPKISQEIILEQIGLIQSQNCILTQGICFSCTFNFTPLVNGLQCRSCKRAYHFKCLKKFELHKSNSPVFECLTCLKKS